MANYGVMFGLEIKIREVENGFVIDIESDTYVAKTLKEALKIISVKCKKVKNK